MVTYLLIPNLIFFSFFFFTKYRMTLILLLLYSLDSVPWNIFVLIVKIHPERFQLIEENVLYNLLSIKTNF